MKKEEEKSELPPDAEAEEVSRKYRSALAHLQEARNCIGRAQTELASIIGALPEWKRVGKLYDGVHDAWNRVEVKRVVGLSRLDEMAIASLRKRLAAEGQKPTSGPKLLKSKEKP